MRLTAGRSAAGMAPMTAPDPSRRPSPAASGPLDAEPVRWLRRMPGRETFVAEGDGGRERVVKRMRGDDVRERWYALLRGRRPRSPARREAESLAELAAAGIRVPAVHGWAEDGRGTSAVAMEHVEHVEDLALRLARGDAPARAQELERLARLVARLHRLGFYHRDLYLTHVVLRAGDDALVLLDAGRVRREARPRRRWFTKDLAALLVSRPPEVTRAEALRFLRRYQELTGRPRAELRAVARRVARKARRLAAHAPRSADPRTHRPGVAGPESLAT